MLKVPLSLVLIDDQGNQAEVLFEPTEPFVGKWWSEYVPKELLQLVAIARGDSSCGMERKTTRAEAEVTGTLAIRWVL